MEVVGRSTWFGAGAPCFFVRGLSWICSSSPGNLGFLVELAIRYWVVAGEEKSAEDCKFKFCKHREMDLKGENSRRREKESCMGSTCVGHKAMVHEDSKLVKENEVDKLPNRVELRPKVDKHSFESEFLN